MDDIMTELKANVIPSNSYELLDIISKKKNGLGYLIKAKINYVPNKIYTCRVIELPKISTYTKDTVIKEYYEHKKLNVKCIVDIEYVCFEETRILFFSKYYDYTLHSLTTLKRPYNKLQVAK